ncbi:hypothetical protein BGZ63DRAFT_160891 [Mariannaea sp. PMI_226]|nr:hypothetical protein BGZ63DRAFT_160891 [Mariannaea sp. PMI_226]
MRNAELKPHQASHHMMFMFISMPFHDEAYHSMPQHPVRRRHRTWWDDGLCWPTRPACSHSSFWRSCTPPGTALRSHPLIRFRDCTLPPYPPLLSPKTPNSPGHEKQDRHQAWIVRSKPSLSSVVCSFHFTAMPYSISRKSSRFMPPTPGPRPGHDG